MTKMLDVLTKMRECGNAGRRTKCGISCTNAGRLIPMSRTEPGGTPERTGSEPEQYSLDSAVQKVGNPLPGVIPDVIPV